MSSTELYVKDARVWIPHPETVWQGAVVLADYRKDTGTLELVTDRGAEKVTLQVKSTADLPHLRNPAILIGQNDLTALSYLHEPDVLYNLEVRFCDRHAIYTYCGIVLVAINPYAELPLYGPDLIRAYRGHSMGELEPHIFAVAEEAYAKLEREKCDISIIVSGESGAGKTVSAKYAMRYFAAVGGSESETQIEKKVLASNPIMEAIGNAKTTRNDNSSRFGKFTKLLFTNNLSMMSLTGGTMQTYLLEKSRVVFQAPGERNYHIFYQLCASRKQYPELMLDHQDKFHFLNQGQSPDIARVSDEDQFKETMNALKILGFDDGEVNDIMKMLAAVLHLGNIDFSHKYKKQTQEVDQEACSVASDDLHLNIFSDILKLNRDELRKWLVTRQIESFNDSVLIPQNKPQSEASRDALAKHVYAEMFQFIVKKINRNLAGGKKQNCFIGVLDIYGFETFDINSFEQFCINYANEKLQQQFNQHVFKLEQEQYLKEGIEWKMIDFYDNQPCIDLIEAKLGILDLLDEECRMPRGSDESWVGKLMEKCTKYKHFDKPRFGTSAFLIKHFSDTVQYESQGFLEKNRDTVSKELVNVLRMSEMKLCHKLMTAQDETAETPDVRSPGVKLVVSAAKSQPMTQKQQRKTVGSQFRESLTLLITTLHNTTPHYVRCIKPNEDKAAFKWEPPKIVQQLRACGVLETVRISAAGFPSRWTYEDFYERYRLLCKRVQIVDWNVKATCTNIVRNWLTDSDKYRLGNTQIFFRAGQVAYLEQLRSDVRKKHIILVQSLIRRFICRNKYLRLKRTALGLQRHVRGMLARKKADNLRKNRAAIKIQRYMRGWLQRTKYQRTRKTVLGLQTYARGMLARRKFKLALDNYKAIQIQRLCRGYLARQRAQKHLASIIKCQATVRRFLARRLYKRLKAEARTISHIQKMYKGLENKIIELQQRYDTLSKESAVLKKQNAEIPEMRQKLDETRRMQNELKALKLQLEQKDEKLLIVIKQLENERDEKMILLEEKQKEEEERMKERAQMEQDLAKMRDQVNEINNVTKIERDRLLSQADTNEIHAAYQRMVKDKDQLEGENNALRHELRRLQHMITNNHDLKTHSRSVSNASSTNEEDYGYNSGKNTLEIRPSPLSYEGEINNNLKLVSGNVSAVPPLLGGPRTSVSVAPPPVTGSSSVSSTSSSSIGGTPSIGNHISSQRASTEASAAKGRVSMSDYDRLFRTPPESFSMLQDHSTPNTTETPEKDQTAIILKMRKLFEQEKDKSDQLRKEVARFRKSSSLSTEDSIRASELEVEIEKLRQDYNLLRNSIKRGVEEREMEAQYLALQEELKRRREECISLKAVLAQQSQSLRTLGQSRGNNNGDSSMSRIHDEGELMEAFQAQKLVNRQLEAELSAMMEANNETLVENNKLFEALRKEVGDLQSILQSRLENTENADVETLRLNEQYLRHELKKSTAAYVELQEQINELLVKINELTKKNHILSNRLRDHGLNDSILMNEEFQNMVTVKKKAQSNQGILKYRHEDETKIIQRLVTDLKPRVAVTLVTSLPAYVVFMCIRYTDLVNTDQHVRSLLTRFVQMIKRLFKAPNPAEIRVMWLVNTLTLHNLLKQFGGYPEYMQYNTEPQNQQQLKNFDLSEYRQVIHETIILMHGVLLRQVQESIKQFIVPAILDHDETSRGKSRGRTMSLDMSPEQNREPKTLVQQLDIFYKHLSSFGMENYYIEQICKQLMYYICAVAVNSLMLRGDLCMWKTGMKIRYNVGCLESWVRTMSMDPDVVKPLEPLIQISRILQARKTEEDVQTLLELSTCLTTAQILKIIKSYTTDDCENEIKPIFIEKLTKQLNERSQQSEADTYMMDEEIVSPLVVVYKYSEVNLEEVDIPDDLNLGGLITKI
ncbi:unconventional myosin-Va isoform X2 [Culex pipiens pallens]|uniref:unconventional myosin-Va isoform X2 n=1 Tax=Culex pipiens pallens TaxID=42434 RepID=UPI0019547B6E|nr:unconventional myosin-Va isoform X2 [Culex pipiens pallens]